MLALLLLHLLLGITLIAAGPRTGRMAFALAAIAPAATLAYVAAAMSGVIDGRPVVERWAWVTELGMGLDLRLDAFALVMVALVAGVGVLVCVYAVSYFTDGGAATGRLAGLMTLFAGSMLGVVLADHLVMLFVCWELTSVTSYLLIGDDDRNPRARAAALQAILITGGGGLAMMLGIIVIGQAAGTYRLSELAVEPPSGGAVAAGIVCVLVGAFTKSAQAPFGSWLPGAMVAPTPISAYLHSATMVKAGVYLVARLSPMFATTGPWRALVMSVGATTMLIGGLRAMRQHDLKLLLAFGTVSQLGFLMLLFGTGEYAIAQAGVVLLLAHGAFKAALFMVVGIIDHETGTRDVRGLHGFGPGWRPVLVIALIAAASMAGLPPLLGFVAKEKALDAYLEHGAFSGAGVVLVVIVTGSILTFAYSARFVLGVTGRLADATHDDVTRAAHAPPVSFWVAPALLTAFTVAAGLGPVLIDDLVRSATVALDADASPSSVRLWVGVNTALVLSVAVVVGGLVLAAMHARVSNAQLLLARRVHRLPSTEQAFLGVLRQLTAGARRTAAIVQNGSLPIYLAIIITTAAVVPVLPVLARFDGLPRFVEVPIHVPLAALVVAGALGAALVTRRIAAALMLGAVGYAMAGFYVAQGAPDLALTQFAIETLTTVLFVLVLRFLPRRWDDRSTAVVRPLRLVVSLAVGASVFVFALVASESRTDVAAPQVSEEMIERSSPDAKGNNVVNVILVDFRGLDTLGEVTVLLAAAVGAVALARAGRHPAAAAPETPAPVVRTEEPV